MIYSTSFTRILSLVFTEPKHEDENQDGESLVTHEFLLKALATVSVEHVHVAMETTSTFVQHLERLLAESKCRPLVVIVFFLGDSSPIYLILAPL